MGGLFLAIAIIILIVNFFINSGNIVKIVRYCLDTNTLDKYWETFFKVGVSGRALISSIIGAVTALLVFLIIAPIVLFRKGRFESKREVYSSKGLLFEYLDFDAAALSRDTFTSNIYDLGLPYESQKVTGKLRVDAVLVLAELKKLCEEKEIRFEHNVMQEVEMESGEKAIVPVMLIIDKTSYPTYFVYTPEQVKQYVAIEQLMLAEGYKRCIYFSTEGSIRAGYAATA